MLPALVEVDDMEERIARLESDVGHMQSDIAEMKIDLRAVRDKLDELRESIASAKIWALLLVGAVLTVMARGFKWL
jgi:hypothetical protein